MNAHRPDWIISQIGARQHYAVPIGFHEQGVLRTFYTDAWCRIGYTLFNALGGAARAFAGRRSPRLPSRKVVSFTPQMVSTIRARPTGIEDRFLRYVRTGQDFAARVARHLSTQPIDPQSVAFFAFNTGALETLELLSDRGVFTVLDQIDASRLEDRLVADESRRWPGWQRQEGSIPDDYFRRLESEWRAASVILVNSEWSRNALVQQGVPARKLVVVPIGYSPPLPPPSRPLRDPRAPLRVLWLGQVNLRKGIPYVLEAARLLSGQNIEFRIAGPIAISDDALNTAPANISFHGPVDRLAAPHLYQWADVFLFPTISDGFGIVQLEAMAHGLPVIATANCGRVVTHDVDGLTVPIRDAAALAAAIDRLHCDRALLADLSYNARATAARFSVEAVASLRLSMLQDARVSWVESNKFQSVS